MLGDVHAGGLHLGRDAEDDAEQERHEELRFGHHLKAAVGFAPSENSLT